MALNSAEGFLYIASLAAATTSAGAVDSGYWYRISGMSATGPLPANLTTGDIFYQLTSAIPTASTIPPTSNDAVQKITLTKLGFVTDVAMSISKEKFDETVQTDDVKSYQVSGKPEKSGSISGYWVDNDTHQQSILKRMDTVVEATTTGGVTRTSPQTSVVYLMLARDETTANASVVFEWLPCIIESLQSDKPMEGPQPFTFNYTAKGSEKPQTYIRDL